ncbi:ATP-dependent helicase [Bifidobacterium avesanii]|uniref:DNA 3'-5' helicase n=1 Tax=Bifidobacterium avesanii TaxID=1798157 RepID=A0A7K3TJV3_9BIFI|nr:ATP-dependent DNA helicase [Bifidobacterium avesanii]KAB8292639.1 UvrD/REP helicase [Bifidobacterium avesanii]NEG78533.1 AAA family ATPase [Bifidobacterium avesanii]
MSAVPETPETAKAPERFVPSPEQAAVLDAPTDADVLVVAGAGSGKTFTMTRRIIRLIDRGVAPERILGLTFTRKAASELLSRVCAAVESSVLKPEVSTYDAFFQSIVRQYGLLVGFDRNTQPLSEAGAFQLACEVIDERFDLVRAARDEGLDMGSFATLAGAVLALSDAIGGAMIGDGCTTVEDAVARIRRWDGAFADRLDHAIGDEPVPDERPKAPARPRGKKDLERRMAAWRDDCFDALHRTCVYTTDQLRRTVRRREVLLSLVEAYHQAKRRRNMAEFGDFTIAAFQLVTRFPSIGEECRRRYTHVLLDEYQDTSTTQAMLLAALFHRGAGAGERSAVSAVGDPFQSIYAWRGASPGAFRMFQRDFGMDPSDRPRALSVTRRNARIVLDAANALTLPLRRAPRRPGSSLMREVDVPALSALPGKGDGTLGLLGYQTLGQEIDGVARFCKAASATWRAAAEREAAARGETADPSPRVAVLFRSKTRMPAFREGLEAAGLRVLTVGYSALLERPDVRDMLALLHAAGDHTDAAPLMRLLATPRYGLSAADLAALADLAERLNVEYRYRALAEAGLADPDAPASTWAGVVREHRDEVANAVFLPDLLLRDDLPERLAKTGTLSEAGVRAVLRASQALRRVRRTVGRPLADVVRAAVEALDLDVDTVLAQAIARPDGTVLPAQAHAPLETVIELVDTYTQEIVGDGMPSLAGFMAWVDSLRAVPEEAQGMPDEPADVVLMTVHQSKGLEWDAVAVVGMGRGDFPSSQGDRLKVEPDPGHPGRPGGDYEPPEYHESAHTWLENPAAVPVPMRVDAGILPRFPHDAAVTAAGAVADPVAALDALDDVETIDDEVFGSMRAVPGLDGGDDGDGGAGARDRDAWYLTQSEEYGRRLHADERRLAYVALTRARTDALLTFSASGSLNRDPNADGPAKPLDEDAKASNFWLETRDALAGRTDRVAAGASLAGTGADATDADSADDSDGRPELPVGFFAGDAAADYEARVVGDAWREPVAGASDETGLPWPGELSARLGHVLAAGAEAVRARMADGTTDGRISADGGTGDDSLLAHARMLCDDEDLMGDLLAAGAPAADLDAAVRAKGMRLAAGSRRSVTALQALGGDLTERESRDYWRGVVRPIPRVASPNAQAGTVFHAWAERLLDAKLDPDRPDAPAPEAEGTEIGAWQRRLLASPWASRMPVWAERQLVVSLPELDGGIVNGKLDAVFRGGLDSGPDGGADGVRYTIVDWKTGRRPRTAEETRRKLAQLDLYRLLLARVEGLPIGAIDAALYYVSEADPARRLIPAEPKGEGEILGQLRVAVPEGSDED